MVYNFFPSFVFRSPILPINDLNIVFQNRESLLENLSTPFIQEALYIASPVLYKELKKLLNNTINDQKEIDRIINSCSRYINRMSTRCTPFGLFAGCGLGQIGQETNIKLEDETKRVTRLDMYYLCTLYDALIKKRGIKEKIRYYTNSSLYFVGKKIRYIETQYVNSRRKYQVTEIQQSSYLNRIIKKARSGVCQEELISLLISEEITTDDACDFINELISSQILVGELNNSVTGDDFLSRIIKMLKDITYLEDELPILMEIDILLKKLDRDISENNIKTYEKIIGLIKQINIPFEEKYLFQVDIIKKVTNATLGLSVIKELQKTMEFLNKITTLRKNEVLIKFQEDFYSRYEDKEVPLMEALDPELGIGYPSKNNDGDISPLIDNFFIPLQQNQILHQSDLFMSVLLKKALKCIFEQGEEIYLNDDDINDLKAEWGDLPPTIYTMCEILNSNPETLFIKTAFFGGSCGANLLGRFAHADKDIETFVKSIAEKEQELIYDKILAEIVHLPESRVGNILSRPHIRNYELLYLSDSDLPQEYLLHVSDLTLSVKYGKLVIRSKKLDKEIIPRLTTAHNYRNNPMPVYRFLSEMQNAKGRNELYFDWGYLERELDYRPRVRYNNTILSPASWTIRIVDIKALFDIQNGQELVAKVLQWRSNISLPEKVLMPDGDNELYVDWSNAQSISSLFSIIKNRKIVKFNEFLYYAHVSPITGSNGKYVNECVVAFYKK